MAFTTGRQDITPRRGTDSYLIICEQPNGWEGPDENNHNRWPEYEGDEAYIDGEAGTYFRPYIYQPRTSSIGIVREGTTIEVPYFKGTPIRSKDIAGPSSTGGDLAFDVSGNGTALILRSILQDLNPVATKVDAHPTISILAPTTASGTTTTTTFVDDLSDVYVPVQISVTLSGSPTISPGEETAEIIVAGTNRLGEHRGFGFVWTPADITAGTLTKTSTVFFSTITQAEPSGHFAGGSYQIDYDKPPHTDVIASGTSLTTTNAIAIADNLSSQATPQRIFIDPDGAAMTATTTFAYVNITGTDVNGTAITNRVRYQNNSTDLARTKPTKSFFATVTGATVEGFSAGTFGATAVNTAEDVQFSPSTDISVFWTVEAGKGKKADTYRNVIPNSTSLNFDRTEPVRATATVIGGAAQLGFNLETAGRPGEPGNPQNDDYPTSTAATSTPTNRTKLFYTSPDVYAGWQADFRIGNRGIAARSATLTINHNLNESDLLGAKYPPAAPTGAGERDIVLTIELQTDDNNDYRDIYDCNETLEDVSIRLTNIACGAYPHELFWEFPGMVITEDPDFVVDDFDIIGQTISLRAVGEEGLDYEFRVRAKYSEYYPVLDFSS